VFLPGTEPKNFGMEIRSVTSCPSLLGKPFRKQDMCYPVGVKFSGFIIFYVLYGLWDTEALGRQRKLHNSEIRKL
jgi:hypothetical protein